MHWTNLDLITAPEPALTVDDLKSHLAIAHDDEDSYLETLIAVATAYIDGPNGIGIALKPQTWALRLTDWAPRQRIRLPLRPISRIVSVTADDDLLWLDDHYTVGRDMIRVLNSEPIRDLEILFEVGFETVPADLLHAIRMIVGHLYANREAVGETALTTVPMAVDSMLNRYRVIV